MNTIEQNLERLAEAQERTATALESILEHIANFKIEKVGELLLAGSTLISGTADETTITINAAATEAIEADPEPEVAEEPAAEEPAAEEAQEAGEAEDDPLGDGDGGAEELVAPKDLTTDVLRGKARELMDKEGKAAVFEVLAEVGKGYKAVGEVPKEELAEAWLKMAKRLQG